MNTIVFTSGMVLFFFLFLVLMYGCCKVSHNCSQIEYRKEYNEWDDDQSSDEDD